MSPRSILKHSSSASASGVPSMAHALPYHPPPPQVHFPPTTAVTQTHYTHSGAAYDRAPIVVMPNDCAMPERGCRTYTAKSAYEGSGGRVTGSGGGGAGKHPHPRVADASSDGRIPTPYGPHGPANSYHHPSSSTSSSSMMMALRTAGGGPPPLVPDLSSESDESDGIVSPPPEYYLQHSHVATAHGAPGSHHHHHHSYGSVGIVSPSQEQLDKALAFLPHAPPVSKPKERKRRSETRFKSADASRSFASSSLDGCLGGF